MGQSRITHLRLGGDLILFVFMILYIFIVFLIFYNICLYLLSPAQTGTTQTVTQLGDLWGALWWAFRDVSGILGVIPGPVGGIRAAFGGHLGEFWGH